MNRYLRAGGGFIAAIALLSGCTERLPSEAACPELCPEQQLEVRDTVIDAVVVDTTLFNLPALGSNPQLLVSRRGTQLHTVAVMRFDSLQRQVAPLPGQDVVRQIVGIDTAYLNFTIGSGSVVGAAVTLRLYDVDHAEPVVVDTAQVRARLVPGRLLTTRVVPQDSVDGVLRLAVPKSFVEQRLATGRIRLALEADSDEPVTLRVVGSELQGGPVLSYQVRTDRHTPEVPDSLTLNVGANTLPAVPNVPAITALADYTFVVVGNAPPPPQALVVGGLPSARTYLRFAVPTGILDSSTVVRASLVLHQIADPGVGAADTVRLIPRLVFASPSLDPLRSSVLLTEEALPSTSMPLITPSNSGPVSVDLALVLRAWRSRDVTTTQRALVLQSALEGGSPGRMLFHSTDAPVELRPRLRISYIPRARFGLP